MITVSLIGGLGNQMFQYAAGKALAERHGASLALDLGGFRNYNYFGNYNLTPRPFLLDRLRVPEAGGGSVTKAAENFVRAKSKELIDRLLSRGGLPKLAQSPQDYREPHFHYDHAFEALGPQTNLFGYFQSERYFGSIAECLRDWFAPRKPLVGEMLGLIQASRLPISVHVRRGDYLNPDTAEVHGILGEPYYRQALGRLERATGREAELFVFSDDPPASEQVLNFVPRSRLVHVRGEPERPWEDMALMAHCRHHIIANSSFSWWGAWLNRSPDKIVIAPHAWFAPNELKKRNTCDLYPPGWLVI
jgi:hypothetical protein